MIARAGVGDVDRAPASYAAKRPRALRRSAWTARHNRPGATLARPVKSAPLSVVFFDVDGVLLDSLPQHLRYCALKAREYRFDLRLPDIDQLRDAIGRGLVVSPMLRFFLAVGFPVKLAERGVADYEREFARRCPPRPFPGVEPLLRRLRDAGLVLGLVTSNTRANVEPALGAAIGAFDSRAMFFHEPAVPAGESRDKRSSLLEGARRLGVPAASCVYVGDQPGDVAAAAAAGVRFLGVRYGWGLVHPDPALVVVDTVPAIADALLAEQPR
jgi:N-acetyl-D-muramate 6-phosphate phosphatase